MRHMFITFLLGLSLATVGCSKKSDDKNKAKEKAKTDTTETTTGNTNRARPSLRRPRRRIDNNARAKRMQARFKLTDEQTQKLEEMYKNTPRREQRAKMKEIFTEEQWKSLSSMRRGGKRRGFGMNPARRAQFMKARFKLTDDQVNKVTEIFKTTPRREQREAIEKLLDVEQKKKWNATRRRQRPGVRPLPGSAPANP